MALPEKAASTIKKHSMLSGGETVLVGLSGGPDSVCLLSVLKMLPLGLRLHALYIDHGLRPEETPAEKDFCRSLCRGMDVPFSVRTVEVRSYAAGRRMSVQEAARELRYGMLEEVAAEAGAQRIALGHNLDDQCETFFMRILRGAGPRGLAGMPPVRGKIIRPLIETERKDIEAFLKQEGVGFVSDSSNLKRDYLRNRIRFALMPLLKELNPSIMDTLSITTDILREEDRHLELAVTKAMMRLISRKSDRSIELFLAPLKTLDKVVLRRVLRRAVHETRGLRGISFLHIEDVIGLIAQGKPGDRLYLPGGIRAIKKYSTLLITSEPPARLGEHLLDAEGTVVMKEARAAIKASFAHQAVLCDGRTKAVFDADKVAFPLTVRARRPGDFFHPLGFGRRKKLQDYFVDEKIPRDERDSIPIVIAGGDILWVAGYRADDRLRPSGDTKRFLVLEIKPVEV
jgi:tRNA(Ile)-lysidine synthase